MQELANTSQGAARTRRADKSVKHAVCLLPNLRTGRTIVRIRIGGIIELVGPNRVGDAFCIVPRLVVIVLRVLVRDCGNGVYLRAQHAQEIYLLLTLAISLRFANPMHRGGHDHKTHLSIWHEDDAFISLGSAHMRETYTGVSGSPFDNSASWLYAGSRPTDSDVDEPMIHTVHAPTLCLGILDDSQGSTVLDATSGILEFSLTVDVRPSLFRECLQIDLHTNFKHLGMK